MESSDGDPWRMIEDEVITRSWLIGGLDPPYLSNGPVFRTVFRQSGEVPAESDTAEAGKFMSFHWRI